MRRSKFSLSHYKLFTSDLGELIPCGMFEVLPGDTIQQATSLLVRCTALLSPVMHPVHVRIHHWFVPYRLIWNDWENFITGGPDGLNASVFPTKDINPSQGTLSDYLGVTPSAVSNVSALPYRAYALIWNEWYRDQDLETALTVDLTDGTDSTTNTTLQNCDWEKDYFTSARPWEQKGPAITIPLGTTAPTTITRTNNAANWTATVGGSNAGAATQSPLNITAGSGLSGGTEALAFNPNGGLTGVTDLSGASAVTINVLREALALQRFEEARARYGSRYVEYLRYLGVRSSDARLSRPEYLGGGRQTIQFSEVLQTAEGTNPVGKLRGHGITALRSNRYRRFIEEHGLVMTLCSVKPKTMYAQGLNRSWLRRTKEDFFQKELQHIGQQAIENREVYAAHASPTGTFGFQDRYDEYRRQESSIAGDFRSSTADYWHMARVFTSDPALNATFVKCVPTERTFALPSSDVLNIMANHSIQARRLVASSGNSFIF